MRHIPSILVVISALSLAACGGNKPPPAGPTANPAEAAKTEEKKPSGPVKPIGEAQVGDTTKCPVSGEEFVVSADSPKVEHEGKTYYFCCSGCAKKFGDDPAKFLQKTGS